MKVTKAYNKLVGRRHFALLVYQEVSHCMKYLYSQIDQVQKI